MQTSHRTRSNRNEILVPAVLLFGSLFIPLTSQAQVDDGSNLSLLRAAENGTDVDILVEHLVNLRPNQKLLGTIHGLIDQLDSREFATRDAATKSLSQLGGIAKPVLLEAVKKASSETRFRIEKLLAEFDSVPNFQQRQELLLTVINRIKFLGNSRAVSVLFNTLEDATQPSVRDRTCEAIWACSDKTNVALIQRYVAGENGNEQTKVAAIVALEVAIAREAIVFLSPLLDDRSELIQLAVCRAIIDHQPLVAQETLIQLVDSDDEQISSQAWTLLAQQTGMKLQIRSDIPKSKIWISATGDSAVGDLKKLGVARLDLSKRLGNFLETFSQESQAITKDYHDFVFESKAPTKIEAFVKDGVLHLPGNDDESDRRLFVTSQRLGGSKTLPDTFSIKTKLGCTEGNNFGFHVGISIGNVKILFHPGVATGAFRVENRDSHEYFCGNQTMGFDPQVDVTNEMVIHVSRVGRTKKQRKFDIRVTESESGKSFEFSLQLTEDQIMNFDRIGLERSGRAGGAAIFSEFEYRILGNQRPPPKE